jgi:HEAT repeats
MAGNAVVLHQARRHPGRRPLAAALPASLLLACSLAAGQAIAGLEVQIEGERITADLSQVPIADVLRAVAERTGARLTIRGDLGTVRPQAFSRVPLADALPQLARPNGVLLQFAPAEGGGRRLIAIRAVAPGAIGQPVATAHTLTPPRVRKTPMSHRDPRRGLPAGLWDYDKGEAALPDVEKRIAQLGDIARTRGQAAMAAITYVLVADPDPQARTAAIRYLATLQSSPEGRQALIQAVADADPQVRTEALRMLSQDPRNKPIALLAQVIKGDADRQVRLAAIENLSGNDGELARAVLEGALADEDAEMREAAKQAMARR